MSGALAEIPPCPRILRQPTRWRRRSPRPVSTGQSTRSRRWCGESPQRRCRTGTWLRLIHPNADAGAAYAEPFEALRRSYVEGTGRDRHPPSGVPACGAQGRASQARPRWLRGAAQRRAPGASTSRGARSGWRGSPASRALPAWRLCWPSRPRSLSTGAIPCRRRRRWTAASTSTVTSPRSRPTRGSRSISRKAPRSATTPGFMARAKETGCRRHAAPSAPAWCHARTIPSTRLWADQPPAPLGPIAPHPARFAGAEADEKREVIAARLAEKGAAAAVLSAARFHRLAAQRPGRRRCQQPPPPLLRHPARRRGRGLVRGCAQAAPRGSGPSRQCRARAGAGDHGERARRPCGRRQGQC